VAVLGRSLPAIRGLRDTSPSVDVADERPHVRVRATGRLGYAWRLTPYAGGISIFLVDLSYFLKSGRHAESTGMVILLPMARR